MVKTTLFGAIIAIVSCYKGMTASGGAEGVGRSVNQGVVIAFLAIFAFNYVFTQTLPRHPPRNLHHQVMTEDLLEMGERVTRALTIALLAVSVVVGSAMLWIGLPVAGLWLAGELTDRAEMFLFVALLGIPLSMVVCGWAPVSPQRPLRGHARRPRRPAAPVGLARQLQRGAREALRRARGPRTLIEVSMTASAIAALVLIAIWFFFFADSPLAPSMTWLTVPQDLIASLGDVARFGGRVVADVFSGRVFRFFGEALRQAGILILGSAHRDLGPGLHPRPPVRHRGRVLQPLGGRTGQRRACSPPGATCARSSRTRSAT